MLFIAFMLNILKIRFDFLCSDRVLSEKWEVKTQHEETIFFCHYTTRKEKKTNISEEERTSHREMDAGVWKPCYAHVHLNVRKSALGGNDLNSSICGRWHKVTVKHWVIRNNPIFSVLCSSRHKNIIENKEILKPTILSLLCILLRTVLLSTKAKELAFLTSQSS